MTPDRWGLLELVALNQPVACSRGVLAIAVQSNTYDPANTIDGNKGTAWIEGAEGPGWGEWIRFEFDREINLHRVLILPGYFKSPAIWARNNRFRSHFVVLGWDFAAFQFP
ncbi:MAG: hypothetical protein H0V18_11235 [Pyrinomonadaceae bacterium]|nr:hypothetical protein [Pyrinomonadaceae bacterium]